MSAEKGGALVRSPPGLIGVVDGYNAHIGKGTKWDHPTPPHLPISGSQPQQQKNASVTKLSSGGKGSVNSKNSRKKKIILQNGISDEDERICGCEASTRVRQLEHDFDQLHKIHDAVLRGLHQQMEELKQKNRDLTFQLLMGPYATTVQMGVPQSPESDTTTTNKEENKKEDKSTSTSETELEITPQQERANYLENIQPNESTALGEKTVVRRRQRRGRSGDPRQVRSLDIELLEEEADELRKELEKERDKNTYLIALTEDLKRQIRDENGSWHPPQLPATKRAMQPPLKPMPINISSLDSQMQRSDAFLSSSYSSLPDYQQEQNASVLINASNSWNNKLDNYRPPLPLIRKKTNDMSSSSESALHLVEELKVEHQHRTGSMPLTKPQSRPLLEDIIPQDKIRKTCPFENEHVSPLDTTQSRADQRPRKQQEVRRNNEHFIFQSPKKVQQPVKSRKIYHQPQRQTATEQLNLQDLPQHTKIKSFQRRRSSSGSMTRANGNSKTRSVSQDSLNPINIKKLDPSSSLNGSETKTSTCSSLASSKITSSQYGREPQPLETSQQLAKGDVEIVVKTELQKISEPQETKQRRPKGGKVEFSSDVTAVQSSASTNHKNYDQKTTSSSSSMGSLASTSGNGRPKNKGRPHRRGRGRNKKETTESKGEGKKQL